MDKVTQTIDFCIGVIKGIRPFVPPGTLRYMYNALVQPHFNYSIVVWGSCGETISDNQQKLQKRDSRIVTFFSYDAHAGCLLQQLSWKDSRSINGIQSCK